MSRYLFLSPQAYGDNVLALRLLRELQGAVDLRILGTDLTLQIAEILRFDTFPIVHMPGGTSAVYNVREDGLWKAARDFWKLRGAIRGALDDETVVLFGNQRRPGTHRLLQLLGGNFRYAQPQWGNSAYEDRRRMFQQALGCPIDLPPIPAPQAVHRLVIAPAARESFRAFAPQIIEHLLAYTAGRAHVCLLDPQNDYRQFENRVNDYVAGQPLAVAAERLRHADLLIAPDSLMLHLAYYFGIAAIALVPQSIAQDFYFAPPGLLERKLFLSFDAALDRKQLWRYLDATLPPWEPERRLAASY